MTGTVERDVLDSRRRPIGRGRWIAALAVLILLIGGVVAVIKMRDLDHRYGPIQQGAFGGGPYSIQNSVLNTSVVYDGLATAPGHTAALIASVDNLGSHSVEITSVDSSSTVTSVRWATYRFPNGDSVFGTDMPWRTFPAMVPAHGTIKLLLTIRRPSICPTDSRKSDANYGSLHVVRWKSLLHKHATTIDDGLGIGGRELRVC